VKEKSGSPKRLGEILIFNPKEAKAQARSSKRQRILIGQRKGRRKSDQPKANQPEDEKAQAGSTEGRGLENPDLRSAGGWQGAILINRKAGRDPDRRSAQGSEGASRILQKAKNSDWPKEGKTQVGPTQGKSTRGREGASWIAQKVGASKTPKTNLRLTWSNPE